MMVAVHEEEGGCCEYSSYFVCTLAPRIGHSREDIGKIGCSDFPNNGCAPRVRDRNDRFGLIGEELIHRLFDPDPLET